MHLGHVAGPDEPDLVAERVRLLLLRLVVAVSSHESATFRGGGGHFCGRVARLATSPGLVQLFPKLPGSEWKDFFSDATELASRRKCAVSNPNNMLSLKTLQAPIERVLRPPNNFKASETLKSQLNETSSWTRPSLPPGGNARFHPHQCFEAVKMF